MAPFALARLVNREGILGGLADGLLENDDTTPKATGPITTPAADNNGGLVGGILGGVGGVTSGLGEVASAVGNLAPTSATAQTTSSAVSTSSTTSSTSAPVSTSSIISSSASSALSSTSSSSAPSLISSSPSSALPSSTTPAVTSISTPTPPPASTPFLSGTAAAANADPITSTRFVSGATASTTPTPKGFLDNKPLAAGVFSVVGIIGLILLFIIGTFFLRRRRRDRLQQDAVDFSPTTHLTGNDDTGYPNSLHRTNSIGSQVSRRAPDMAYIGRESPERTYNGAGGYGAALGYGATNVAGYPGYYNQPIPPQPAQQQFMTTQQMQQSYNSSSIGVYAQPLPPALRPGAPPAQNPFEPQRSGSGSSYSGSRRHSPENSQSELAYAGIENSSTGRPTSKGRPPALQLPVTFGADNASLKVVNG